MPSSALCLICGASEEEVEKLHYFPANLQRSKIWQEVLGITFTGESLRHRRICSRHFDASSYFGGKLGRHAIPKATEGQQPPQGGSSSTTNECGSNRMVQKCEEIDASVTIRKSKKEDMEKVITLIKELAQFENMENQVKIDASVLIEDGFNSPNPAFNCLVAEVSEGNIIGYALYFNSYSTWLGRSLLLEDLYVSPDHRGSGVGKRLFTEVAKIAHELPAKRMDFHVLSWNPATEFYESLGAINLTASEKWQLFRLDEEALDRLISQ